MDPFADATADILEAMTSGVSAVYHQTGSSGEPVELYVDIDRDVEVVDETGAYARKAMASFRSGQVTVCTGDLIEISDDEGWDVEQKNSDDGYLTQVIVRPRL